MATNHKRRFARWRKTLDARAAFLVDQVCEVLLPPLFAQGFEWADRVEEFGAIADSRADSIPLQRRSGDAWPTITIDFDQRKRANFRIEFSQLPEHCLQRGHGELLEISRREARVFNGPLYFRVVRRERKSEDSRFGYRIFDFISQPYRVDRLLRYAFAPKGLLAEEVGFARRCMVEIEEMLRSGVPREWEAAPLGRIGRHLYLSDSDHWRRMTDQNLTPKPAAPTEPQPDVGEAGEENEEEDFPRCR
jgi:hypothetical protein